MQDRTGNDQVSEFTTPHLADACLRTGIPVRCAPASLRALVPGGRASGRVRRIQRVGSVDIFLEALGDATPGGVLVVDNAGRLDEACVGDLSALETKSAGLAGIVIGGFTVTRARSPRSDCLSSAWAASQSGHSDSMRAGRMPCAWRLSVPTPSVRAITSWPTMTECCSCRTNGLRTSSRSHARSATPSMAGTIVQDPRRPIWFPSDASLASSCEAPGGLPIRGG